MTGRAVPVPETPEVPVVPPAQTRPPKVRTRPASSLLEPTILRRGARGVRQAQSPHDGPQPGHVRGRDRQRDHHGGIIAPFVFIKLLDLLLAAMGLH